MKMSTIIVAGTLLMNAGAVLNFKLSSNEDESFGDEVRQLDLMWGGGFKPIILENSILRYELKGRPGYGAKMGPNTKIYKSTPNNRFENVIIRKSKQLKK